MNQMEYHLVQNLKENCHHDHIPFNLKGNGIIVFSVHGTRRIFSQSCLDSEFGIQNLDCNDTIPIDLRPYEIPFVAKSIGKG